MAFDPKMTIIHCRRCYRCSFILICFLLLHYLSVIGLSPFQITFSPSLSSRNDRFLSLCFVLWKYFPSLQLLDPWKRILFGSFAQEMVRYPLCLIQNVIKSSTAGHPCQTFDDRMTQDPRHCHVPDVRRAFFRYPSFISFRSFTQFLDLDTHTHTHTTSFIDCVRLSPYYHRLDIRNLL